MEKENYTFTYEPIPNNKNIEYVFQRLIIAVLESMNYELYNATKNEWKKIFDVIVK